MAIESSVGLRVTIWRPYAPDRPLAFQQAEATTMTAVGPEIQLQQEAFTWQVREDIWGGVVDSNLRERLSQRFISDFEPVLPPSQRGMDKLKALLSELANAIPEAEWSASGQQVEEDGETPYRLNSLLAFHVQMSWLYDVFKDTPGASVSVR